MRQLLLALQLLACIFLIYFASVLGFQPERSYLQKDSSLTLVLLITSLALLGFILLERRLKKKQKNGQKKDPRP